MAMRSFARSGSAGLSSAASRHDAAAGSVSPATLRLAQEADATMSPDGWEAGLFHPGLRGRRAGAQPTGSEFTSWNT